MKKKALFAPFISPERNFFNIFVLSHCICIEYIFKIYIVLHIKKTLLHTLLLPGFKIVENLQCILKRTYPEEHLQTTISENVSMKVTNIYNF